ncbi:MAG: ArsR family transcriptional regulator [Methanomicrobiales archaeon]|nr:ArsR family transcriptional regulator [Methanomicrobiales archaeon]
MISENVHYFSDHEEKTIQLLASLGMKNNVAKVLVFLMSSHPTTSRDIERGTDLRQPEVSLAIKYLETRGWVTRDEGAATTKGRPIMIFELAMSVREIMDSIEEEKTNEAKTQLARVRQLRECTECA